MLVNKEDVKASNWPQLGEALNVNRAILTISCLLGDMQNFLPLYVCICIFPSTYKCPFASTEHSFSGWKEKKKLHSNSRLFVKFITDTICVFDNQVEHSQDELLSSNVGLTEETATEV